MLLFNADCIEKFIQNSFFLCESFKGNVKMNTLKSKFMLSLRLPYLVIRLEKKKHKISELVKKDYKCEAAFWLHSNAESHCAAPVQFSSQSSITVPVGPHMDKVARSEKKWTFNCNCNNFQQQSVITAIKKKVKS